MLFLYLLLLFISVTYNTLNKSDFFSFLFPSLILAYLSIAETILLSKDVVKQVFEKCRGMKTVTGGM